MTQAQQLHIVEDRDEDQLIAELADEAANRSNEEFDPSDFEIARKSQYELADDISSLRVRFGRDPDRFVRAVASELGKDGLVDDVRLVDDLDLEETDDVDLGALLAFPDESIMFLGSDPTARDSVPLFAIVIERHQPIPAPETAHDALNLLRPEDIRDAFETEGDAPARQGEWWLLPTRKVPVGTHFQPGVNERPYGPSPLGNHVPREYGFTVPDDEFMDVVRDCVDELPSSITSPPEVIEWVDRQHRKASTPEFAPTWDEIQNLAGDILVRGTLRHRENDHYVEDVGEEWHSAQTHNMDVYTGDDYIDRVRID